MAWLYTILLALCSAGILGYALFLTRRLFRDEVTGPGRRGTGSVTPTEVPTTTGEMRA